MGMKIGIGLGITRGEGVGVDPFYGPALTIGTPDPVAGWTWDDATKTATHTPGNTGALKVPVAGLVAQNDYQENFIHSGCTAGSVDLVMSDGASATFNKMTGTVDDNSTNWFVTFTAPAGASHVELRPTAGFDGTVVIESLRKIIWDYTIPTPVIQKYYSWDANTLVVQLACPTSVPVIASPTVTYGDNASNAADSSFGYASSAVAGNVANTYLFQNARQGDCDIGLKIRNAAQFVAQDIWLLHLQYPALTNGGSYTGGGILLGGVTGSKDDPNNYDAVIDAFICDYMPNWNELSNQGDFVWNDAAGNAAQLKPAVDDHTYAGYNRDQVNAESVHPTYQAAARLDIVNMWGKSAADAMVDLKRNTYLSLCSFEGSSFRAYGLHGFDPAGVQAFRGQPTAYMFGCTAPDMAADGVPSSSAFFMSQYCTFDMFGNWVANRRVVDATQAVARSFVRVGDGYLGTPDDTTFKVRRTPLRGQDARNRIPFTKWGLRYRTVAGPGAWVELDVGRPGPFPAGKLGGSFDMSAVSAQNIELEAWYATHNTIVRSSSVTLVLGGSIGASKLANGDFAAVGAWTQGSFVISGGVASHASGAGTGVLTQTISGMVAAQYYQFEGTVTAWTASVCPPQMTGGSGTIGYPTINRNGARRSYRKAASPTPNTTFRFNPNNLFVGTLDDVSLRAVSFTGNVT